MRRSRGFGALSPSRRILIAAVSILMVGGILIAAIMQQIVLRREESAARERAKQLVEEVLAPSVSSGDLHGTVDDDSYERLNALVTTRIEGGGITSVTILSRGGTVLYDDDRDQIGTKRRAELPELAPVFAGSSVSRIATPAEDAKGFETFVPLRAGEGDSIVAAVRVTNDYGAMQSVSSHPWQFIQIGLSAGLGLCLLLLAFSSGRGRSGAISVAPPGGIRRRTSPSVVTPSGSMPSQVRVAATQARKAEDAYHRMFEQLRQTQEQLREATEQQRAMRGSATDAERRAAVAERRMRSTEAALKAARDQLARMESQEESIPAGASGSDEEDLRRAGNGASAASDEVVHGLRREVNDAEQLAREAAEQLKAAERRLGETQAQLLLKDEEVRELKDQLAASRERARRADALRAQMEQVTAENGASEDLRARLADVERELESVVEERVHLASELAERGEQLQIEIAARAKLEETMDVVQRQAEEAIAASKRRAEEALALVQNQAREALVAEQERAEQIVAAERQRVEQALATERERAEQEVAAERRRVEDLMANEHERVQSAVGEHLQAEAERIEQLRVALKEARTELKRTQAALERADERNIQLGERLARAEQASRLVVQVQGHSPESVAVEVQEDREAPRDPGWEPTPERVVIQELHSLANND